jgi:hypothetical protein
LFDDFQAHADFTVIAWICAMGVEWQFRSELRRARQLAQLVGEREELRVSLRGLTSITLGVPDGEAVCAYCEQFGLTPSGRSPDVRRRFATVEFGRSAEELVGHDPHSALRVSIRIAPRDVANQSSGRPADSVAFIYAREAGGSQQLARYLTRAQKRTAVQALNPQAKSPRKIGTAITSRGGTS